MVIAATRKKKPLDYPQAIAQALEKQAEKEQLCQQARERITQAQAERTHLQTARAERESARNLLLQQISSAQHVLEKQESYVALVEGRAGSEDLHDQRIALQGLQQRYAEIHQAHTESDIADERRLHALAKGIEQEQASIREWQQAIDALGETRQRLSREHGEQLYAESHAALTDLEIRERAAGAALIDARVALASAQQEALRHLAPYPEMRRRLIHEHQAKEDSTSKVLASALMLLNMLITEGQAANEAVAGMPAGCYGILQEMALDPAALQALISGNTAPLQAHRDRLDSLIRQYRANLAAL